MKLHTSVVGWFSLFSENHQFSFLDKLFNFVSSVFKLKITGQGISFLENKIQLVLKSVGSHKFNKTIGSQRQFSQACYQSSFFPLKNQTFLFLKIQKKLQKLKVVKNNENAFKFFSAFYTSTISSCSKESSNSSNSFSRLHPSQLTSPISIRR